MTAHFTARHHDVTTNAVQYEHTHPLNTGWPSVRDLQRARVGVRGAIVTTAIAGGIREEDRRAVFAAEGFYVVTEIVAA